MHSVTHAVNSVQFSTYYKNIFCAATFDYGSWYHAGDLYLFHVVHKVSENGDEAVVTEQLAKYKNGIGIHAITWSEHYVSTIACANHDGSINLWNVNSGKRLVSVKAEKGSSLKSIDWNNLETDLILTGSFSSRVKLFDINNLEIIVGIFAEHTNIVNSVKWNTNNRDEFASVSEDGLCKIWDRRANNKTSVNTLMDRQSPGALRCCDWHKQNDWLLAVGNANSQVVVWDTRNSLQPLLRRYAHGSSKRSVAVNDVKFDTNNPNRLVTCAEDNTVRIWTTENGIFLTQEHQIHRSGVKSIDWNVHDKNVMVSGGSDSKVIASSLSQITQVREFKNLKGELETEKVIPTRPRRPTSKL